MQPCTVCGGVTVNATGHCTGCGSYRGFPQDDGLYGQPPTAAVYPGGGYPAGGGQPAAYPGSGGPAYPGSGGPAYPNSGPAYPAMPAVYPAYQPPGGANRGRPFVLPLIALSITLVVLVVAIVIVVIVRSGQPGGRDGPTAAPATPTGNPDVDPCVVGRWVVTQHREEVVIPDVGEVTFTGGKDAGIEFLADGTGVMTYPGSTSYEGTGNGRSIRLEIEGDVEFEYAARNGTISLRNLRADATTRGFVDGAPVSTPTPFSPDDDPANYSCLDDRLTIRTARYTTDFSKAGG